MKKIISAFLLVLGALFGLTASAQRIDTGVKNTNWKPQYTIDFVVGFDPKSRDFVTNKGEKLDDFAKAVVEQMNEVMCNSNINGKFELKSTYVIEQNIPEVVEWSGPVTNDVGLQNYLNSVGADICLVYAGCLSTQRPESGNSMLRAEPGLGPGKGRGFGCVRIDYAKTLTTIHEVGHIMGCDHSLRQVGTPDPGAYYYGAEREGYGTVMAYGGERIPYFSSPYLYHNGIQMGSEQEDNARVLNERMPLIAALGDRYDDVRLSMTTWEPDYKAQSTEVSFDWMPLSYRITSSDPSWLTASKASGYENVPFTISVKANYTGATRTATITVADYDEGTNADALKPAVITVTQLAEGSTGGSNTGNVSVTSVTAPAEISIPVGYSYQIKASVLPTNATNKGLEWMSFDEDIATVSSTGVVTGKKTGEAGIFVRSVENEWANAMVTVKVTAKGTEPIVPDPGTDPDPSTGGDNGGSTGGGDNGGSTGGDNGGSTGGGDNKDPETPVAGATYTICLDNAGTQLYLTTNEVKDNNDVTYSLSTQPEEFYIVSTDKGYTIQSASSNKYIGYNGTNSWDCFDKADTWTIASIEGVSTTILKDGKVGLGVDKAEDKAGVFTDKPSKTGDVYQWIVSPVKGGEPTNPVEPENQPCATPEIALADGQFSITCATPGATISYSVTASQISANADSVEALKTSLSAASYTISATASAEGYTTSTAATRTFTLAQLATLFPQSGDFSADGELTVEDVARLIGLLLKK